MRFSDFISYRADATGRVYGLTDSYWATELTSYITTVVPITQIYERLLIAPTPLVLPGQRVWASSRLHLVKRVWQVQGYGQSTRYEYMTDNHWYTAESIIRVCDA
jgi:hypothetical protein